jgi:hypothetical protein
MSIPEWSEQFGCGPNAKAFRVVKKNGVPLLLLPQRATLAVQTLQLYPAQTFVARFARTLLALALRCRIPIPARPELFPFLASAPIPSFIRECFGDSSDFGLLLGNANAPGRRWIYLIFDSDAQPCGIVKAGVSDRARELIRAEASFLQKLPHGGGFFPNLRGTLESSVSAVAMDFLHGRPPCDTSLIYATLSPWMKTHHRRLDEFAAWTRVRKSGAPKSEIELVEKSLSSNALAEVLMHGDFAPWNIRQQNEVWMVIDWERGDFEGVPGWDWFHFEIQVDVLVKKKSAGDVLASLLKTMKSDDFQAYAGRAGFSGKEIAVLCSYLAHAIYANRQTEGAETLKLLSELCMDLLRKGETSSV